VVGIDLSEEANMDERDSHITSLLPPAALSRRGFVVTSLAAGFALAVQPVSAETITTDSNGLTVGDVMIPVEGGEIPGYRAMPAAGGPFATILVVQEVFGVHEHIKDICRRLAKQGYFAVAPALYAREGDVSRMTSIEEIMSLVAKVPEPRVASDLDAAAAWAATTGKADTARLGITGFCWGGRQVWLYAVHNPKLKAAVSWYGVLQRPATALTPANPIELVAKLEVPVLGLYGGADQGIPMDQIEALQAALKAAGKPCEIVVYPDTPHGFNADYRPSYRPEQAKDAWARMLAWFKAHGAA
jgi:carboxymethylenebutenolidase